MVASFPRLPRAAGSRYLLDAGAGIGRVGSPARVPATDWPAAAVDYCFDHESPTPCHYSIGVSR